MQIVVKGKNFPLTAALHDLAVRKLGKLENYGVPIRLAELEYAIESAKEPTERRVVHVTMELDSGELLRTESRAADVHVAVDEVVEELHAQLRSLKSRERSRVRGRTPSKRFIAALAGPTGGEYGAVVPPGVEQRPVAPDHPLPAEPSERLAPRSEEQERGERE